MKSRKIDPVRFKETFHDEEVLTQYEAVDSNTKFRVSKWVYHDGHPAQYTIRDGNGNIVLVFEDLPNKVAR